MDEIQRIMQDNNLTLQSKAIYIYLLQTANGKNTFKLKSPVEIQKELKIGSRAYYAHVHRLVACGYIKMKQTRNERNQYSGVECMFLNVGGKENE